MAGTVTVVINQKPYHFESDTPTPDDFRGAVGSDPDYEVWRIVKDPDPEGQLPMDDEQITGPVTVKSGMLFRVVPPGTFGG